MTISATAGLVSNIDYQSLITQLVGVKQQVVTQLNTEKNTFQQTKSAFSTLSSRIEDLKTAADALRSDVGFKVFTTSVTDSTILDASSTSAASPGSYQVVVNTMAKSHKMASNGVAAATDTVAAGPGTFSFQVGAGAAQTVNVDATTTLTGLRDSINGLKAGVTATIVNDGSATNPYKLILTSDTSGTANAINITQNGTSLTFPTTLQTAQDASFTIDGMTYTRGTNNISDVIPGVSFNIKGADPAKSITISLNRDTTEIQKKISAFVDKYNSVKSYITSNNRYDSINKVGGPFFGDSVARSVQDDLRRMMTSTVSGLPPTMNRLFQAGISSDKEGVFSVDATKLSAALSSNYNDVVNLFIQGTSGVATTGFGGLVYNMASQINDVSNGRIKGRMDGLTKNIKAIDNDITNKQDGIAAYETQVRAQFTALETMLADLKTQSSYISRIGG